MENQANYSNIIIPPDFVDEAKHTVLIIDADAGHVQSIGAFLKNSDNCFNIYLYHADMENPEWFSQARTRADAVIVNTEKNNFSTTKDILAEMPDAYYYGPKKFLKNNNRLHSPVDYFTNFDNNK
jgi:hypothetical protein